MFKATMIRRLLANSGFAQLKPLLSPALFSVMPLRPMMNQVKEILSDRKSEAMGRARAEMQTRLDALDRPVCVARDCLEGQPLGPDIPEPQLMGDQILWIYFDQLFRLPHALIDLRPESFSVLGGELVWMPSSALIDWDPAFLAGLRDVYRGFYEDDDALYREAMKRLDLEPASDLFKAHFGSGDQRAVAFSGEKLMDALVQVFEACRDAGVSLHPNFLPFGVYLAGLYLSLETIGGTFDVRGAYEAVVHPPQQERRAS